MRQPSWTDVPLHSFGDMITYNGQVFRGVVPEVARHDKGNAVFLPETFTLVI